MQTSIGRPRVEHRKPLSRDDIPKLLEALHKYGGYRTTVIALRLMLLTFVRTIELHAATWEEIDFARAGWRIPAQFGDKPEFRKPLEATPERQVAP